MNWTSFAKQLPFVLALMMIGLTGCQFKQGVNMDKVVEELRQDSPPQYRACLDREVTKLPKGTISWREAHALIIELRTSELAFKRCGLGAERYYRAKIEAFANSYYQYK